MTISPNLIERLKSIFSTKNWHIDSGHSAAERARFNSFCEMLGLLTNDQANLVLKLTEDFTKIGVGEYEAHLDSIYQTLPLHELQNVDEVFVFPIKEKSQYKDTKSGSLVSYIFHGSFISQDSMFQSKQIYRYDSIRALSAHSTRSQSVIFALDDFIGTGETAISFLDEYQNLSHSDDRLILISIAIMQNGLNDLLSHGCEVQYSILLDKGISASSRFQGSEKRIALQLMDHIERSLDVDAAYNRGYGASEALVSMIRTPDNTFPVYWQRHKIGGDKWPAPFPR